MFDALDGVIDALKPVSVYDDDVTVTSVEYVCSTTCSIFPVVIPLVPTLVILPLLSDLDTPMQLT